MKQPENTIYPEYKESGLEWIGRVPSHWREVRIKDIAILERGKFTHRPRNDPKMYGGKHPFIQTGNVARANKYVNEYTQTLSDEGIKVSRKFNKGTLLMAIAANIGDVAIVGFDTYFPDSVVGFKPIKSNVDYLYYLFVATTHELNRVKVTSTQDNLNLDRLNSLVKYIPPLCEQNSIARHLDEQVEVIEKRLSILNETIDAYNKLKQSLINECVSHGLNASVNLKDSNIKWLGKIPSHWKILRIKDIYVESKKKSADGSETLLSVSEYTGVTQKKDNVKNDEHLSRAESLIGYKVCGKGNLVINTMLAWKRGLGVSKYNGIVSPAYAVYNALDGIDSNYFHYRLRSDDAINEFKRNSTGIIESRLRLYPDDFYSISISVPPLSEQIKIAENLDKKIGYIDSIKVTLENLIEKNHELKLSMIREAALGSVKVDAEIEGVAI